MPTTHRTKVAFIGTGIMGAPIAGHILDAGYDLTVNNRTKSKAEGLLAKGAHWADTPAQAAANADDLNTVNYGSLYDTDPCYMEKAQPGWYTTAGGEYFCQNNVELAK